MQDLVDRLTKLKSVINLSDKKKRIELLEFETGKADLWNNRENARKIMQELSDLKKEVAQIEELSETLEILSEVSDEIETKKAEKVLGKLEMIAYLSGKYDGKSAIVSI